MVSQTDFRRDTSIRSVSASPHAYILLFLFVFLLTRALRITPPNTAKHEGGCLYAVTRGCVAVTKRVSSLSRRPHSRRRPAAVQIMAVAGRICGTPFRAGGEAFRFPFFGCVPADARPPRHVRTGNVHVRFLIPKKKKSCRNPATPEPKRRLPSDG